VWKLSGIQISVDDSAPAIPVWASPAMDVDEIKIDRSFVSGIQRSVYNYRLLGNMIDCGCQFDPGVLRGRGDTGELSVLEELRPQLLQGFLFSRPLPPEQFEEVYFRQDVPRAAGARPGSRLCGSR
jgi:EAL domain-containing protein (putative c-di-GMP-specific phosphodiesterase class I)